MIRALSGMQEILKKALALDEPDFFGIGYYLQCAGKELPKLPIRELNGYLADYMEKDFMGAFVEKAKKGE